MNRQYISDMGRIYLKTSGLTKIMVTLTEKRQSQDQRYGRCLFLVSVTNHRLGGAPKCEGLLRGDMYGI